MRLVEQVPLERLLLLGRWKCVIVILRENERVREANSQSNRQASETISPRNLIVSKYLSQHSVTIVIQNEDRLDAE